MKEQWRKALIALIALAIGITGIIIVVRTCTKEESADIVMEDTMVSIEEVRLRGELYVCSSMIEDYTMKRTTEKNFILPDEEHSCVQTMRQKCSYKIDMDKVEYNADEQTGMVYVKLPLIKYVASTQSTSFLSDDSNYWAEHMPNTHAMKRKVEEQIKKRFDTPNNRRKAERYAEDAISNVLERMGYEVEFVRELEQKKE